MITLVGNKCDLPRKVEYDTAAKFAHDNHCNYIEVSAYSGHNVKTAFKMMCEEVYKKVKSSKLSPDNDVKKDNQRSVLRAPEDLKPKKKGCKC